MKLNRTTLVVPLAGLLLVGAAGAVAATTGDTPDTNGAVVPAVESPSPSAGTTTTDPSPKDTVLTDVLDDLVAKGTITAAQKTAILDGVSAERTARREARQAEREQLQSFLADGVITKAEFDQLPADSRLRTLTTLMDDNQITTEELQALGRGLFGGGRGGHHGFRDGTADDGTATPTPSASPATSG
jgi:polyhydroxyalkanoate synthesis regulator phasin